MPRPEATFVRMTPASHGVGQPGPYRPCCSALTGALGLWYGIVKENARVARRSKENGTAHGLLRKTPERGAGH
jgi:hypothetical protein